MSRWPLLLVALLGIALGAAGMWLLDGSRGDGAADSAQAVRQALLAHPEIIPEAMQKLQDRETGKLVAANKDIVQPFAGAWAGNPKGDVSVVEYYDYNCTYCRASLATVAALVKADPNVRIVYRELPVLAQTSHAAARASLAAARQNRFAAFHDALYKGGRVTDASIAAAAGQAGVSLAAVADPALDAEIERNLRTAGQLGMTGTPSWVIGSRILSGAQPLAELQKAVAAARADNRLG